MFSKRAVRQVLGGWPFWMCVPTCNAPLTAQVRHPLRRVDSARIRRDIAATLLTPRTAFGINGMCARNC